MSQEEQMRAERAAAARARMAELAEKFIARTKNELVTLRAALDALSAGRSEALVDIRHLAHRMAGTGATLGFEKLSDHAMHVEEICDRQAPGAAPSAADRAEIGAAVEAIGAELRTLEAAPRP
jgi:HPt (histidine-containing phosphotransfer) domain-containing protein